MTDPRTPDLPSEEPTAPEQPAGDSFAAEPEPDVPAEPAPPAVDAPPEVAPPDAPAVVDVPAERTLADEDPATPEPGSSDPVVLPPPPGTEGTETTDTAHTGPVLHETAADPATRPRRPWLPLAALGVAVAMLVGGTGYLTWQLRSESRAEQAREDATAAARDAARLLFSYDHETLEADFDKGLSVTTGEFRDQYRRTTTEVVTPGAEQYSAVVVAAVIEAAIGAASADRVTALVFLNQGTTSTRVQGQQVDQSRVRMQLVRRDGRWLVEGVGAL